MLTFKELNNLMELNETTDEAFERYKKGAKLTIHSVFHPKTGKFLHHTARLGGRVIDLDTAQKLRDHPDTYYNEIQPQGSRRHDVSYQHKDAVGEYVRRTRLSRKEQTKSMNTPPLVKPIRTTNMKRLKDFTKPLEEAKNEHPVPHLGKWRTFAGGTYSDGKHTSYQYTLDDGPSNTIYSISPFSYSNGRHRGYNARAWSPNAGHAHKDLGFVRDPREGVKLARAHYDQHFGQVKESSEDLLAEAGQHMKIPQTYAHEFENHPVLKQLPLKIVSIGPGHTELHAYDKGLDMIVAHQKDKEDNHHVLIHSNLQDGKEIKGTGSHKDLRTAIGLAIGHHKTDFAKQKSLKEEALEEAKESKVIFLPGHGSFEAFRTREARDAAHQARYQRGDKLAKKAMLTGHNHSHRFLISLA